MGAIMKNMTLEHIAQACGGTYIGEECDRKKEIQGAVIDSRLVEEGYLFIPIRGARVDGHDFIPAVFEKGALAVLSERRLEHPAGPYILVDSTEEAMKQIAAFYRRSLDIKVVGITGSVGKTSTKEMIASVLSEKYRVLKTEGNLNNEIGLPLTIFKIREEHQVAVLEMGISEFGEMHRLAEMAQPDICVITNIGLCHLENLITRDGILKAKTESFEHLAPDGIAVLNGDDDKLCAKKAAEYVSTLMEQMDSCGGLIECRVDHLPAGLGEPVFDKLDALLAQAIMSIGAVKGVEIGDGFQSASSTGSTNNDPFCMQQGEVMKTSNHSGGTLGGMSDGSQLILRAAIKPTPSISQMQHTVTNSGEEIELSIHGRHDPIIVPRAVVVVEAMTALTLADLLLRNAVSRMNQIKQLYTEDKNV